MIPIATLIDECYQIKRKIKATSKWERDHLNIGDCPYYVYDGLNSFGYKSKPKIVADVIKALCLGADFVMTGYLFTGLLESAVTLNIECYNSHYKYMFDVERGLMHNGVEWSDWGIWNKSDLTDEQWSENMIDYLKTAMSYTNTGSLWSFIGNVDFVVNFNCTILAINK